MGKFLSTILRFSIAMTLFCMIMLFVVDVNTAEYFITIFSLILNLAIVIFASIRLRRQ
ncbi:MAG: hypothetical protein RR086_05815 [Clostridia bacterium]